MSILWTFYRSYGLYIRFFWQYFYILNNLSFQFFSLNLFLIPKFILLYSLLFKLNPIIICIKIFRWWKRYIVNIFFQLFFKIILFQKFLFWNRKIFIKILLYFFLYLDIWLWQLILILHNKLYHGWYLRRHFPDFLQRLNIILCIF